MHYRALILAILLVFNMLSSCFATVIDGTINIPKSSLSEQTITLDGNWEMYWNKLLAPSDFTNYTTKPDGYFRVPGFWRGPLANHTLTALGCATYRTKISTNSPDDAMLIVAFNNIRQSARVYANGQLVANSGIPTISKDGYQDTNKPFYAGVYPKHGEIELVVQVANWSDGYGGIAEAPYIGTASAVWHEQSLEQFYDFFMVLFFAIIAFFLLCLYVLVPNERSLLFFGLSCACFSAIMLCNGQRSLVYLLQGYSWNDIFRLNIIALALMALFINHFIHELDRRIISLRLVAILDVILLAIGVYCVFGAVNTFYDLLKPFFIGLNLWYVWLIVRFISIAWRKRNQLGHIIGLAIIVAALVSLEMCWLYTLLALYSLVANLPRLELFQIGFAILVILYLAYRFSREYRGHTINRQLSSSAEMAFLHTQIKPHFLFNTLNVIASLCQIDGQRAAQVLGKLSRYLRNRLSIDNSDTFTRLSDEIELVRSYIAVEQTRFEDRLQVLYDVDSALLTEPVLPYSIQPLVENAVNHGALKNPDGGTVIVTVKEDAGEIYVSVSDNGPGIIEKIQPLDKSSGVGLTNLNRRLMMHFGTMLHMEQRDNRTIVSYKHKKTKIQFGGKYDSRNRRR